MNWMKRWCGTRWLAIAALVLAGIPSRVLGDEPFNPFHVPKEQVLSRIHAVAFEPVLLPGDIEAAQPVREAIERLVRQALEQSGFATIPGGVFDATWRRLAGQVGDVYNPVTGEVDDKKHDAVWELTARELASQQHADAVLYIGVSRGSLLAYGSPFIAFSAANERLRWQGEALYERPQHVTGTFLSLILHDTSGVTLYSIRTPIEWTDVYVVRRHETRPRDALFSEAHLSAAVARGLADLIRPGRG